MPFTNTIRIVNVILANSLSINAVPDDVASGKLFVGSTKSLETGTLPILEFHESDITLPAGTSHVIEYGKNPARYTVTAQPLSEQTIGTAESSDIKYGKTAWVNGVLVTGEMTISQVTGLLYTLEAGESFNIPEGYYAGDSFVKAKTIEEQTVATAFDRAILNGYTAWVNGELITGCMVNRTTSGPINELLHCSESYTIGEGYYSGGTILSDSLANQTTASNPVSALLNPDGTTYSSADILATKQSWIDGKLVTGNIPIHNSTEPVIVGIGQTIDFPIGYYQSLKVVQNTESIDEPINITPSRYTQSISIYKNKYLTSNAIINVSAVNALAYERPNDIVIERQEIEFNDEGIAMISIPVDNWHDNSTMNVYQVSFDSITDSAGGIMDEGSAILVYDWNNVSEVGHYHFRSTNTGTVLDDLEIEVYNRSTDHAHTFKIYSSSKTLISGQIEVKELFHTRQY